MANKETNQGADGISILDILVAIAESWKLISIGTIAAGLIVWLAAGALPPTYETSAVLRLSRGELQLVENGALVDSLYREINGLPADAPVSPAAREEVLESIFILVDGDSGFNRLGARANSPERAGTILDRAIALLNTRFPEGGYGRQGALNELEVHSEGIASLRRVAGSIRAALQPEAVARAGASAEDFSKALVVLENGIKDLERSATGARERLAAYELGIVASEPGKALRVGIRPEVAGSAAAMLAGLVLLNFVLIRRLLLRLAENPVNRTKLGRIRAAFVRPKAAPQKPE